MQYERRQARTRREEPIWRGRPSWRGMLSYYLKWELLTLSLWVLALLAASKGWIAWGQALLSVCALQLPVLAVGWLIRRLVSYEITTRRISSRRFPYRQPRPDGTKGRLVLGFRREQAPIERIDNVIVSQSIADRLLGVGKINFDTAGEHEGDLHRWWGIRNPDTVALLIEAALNPDLDPLADADEELASESRVASRRSLVGDAARRSADAAPSAAEEEEPWLDDGEDPYAKYRSGAPSLR
jgi:uncharacterized membrane protein YdbT with pleckstrin-like domain